MALPLLSRATPFRFLDLPAELRNNIYRLIFSSTDTRINLGDGYFTYKFDLGLFHVKPTNLLRVSKHLPPNFRFCSNRNALG